MCGWDYLAQKVGTIFYEIFEHIYFRPNIHNLLSCEYVGFFI